MSETVRPVQQHEPGEEDGARTDTNAVILAELLFVAVPFIIYACILLGNGRGAELFTIPEWSFAAFVLFGQTLVRFATAKRASFREARVFLVVAGIFVLGALPSILFLISVLGHDVQHGSTASIHPVLKYLQLAWFGVSLLVFYSFAGALEYKRRRDG